MESENRFLFIDGLRGVAAAMVVLYHLVGRTSAHEISALGYLGVSIFFVLSGFVITMVIGEHKISLGFLWRFAARRSLRLDPPYWASIAVAIALMYLATKIGVTKELPSIRQTLAHFVYLQDLLHFNAISEVYWTLCLEFQFYLFLIVLLWIGRQQVNYIGFQFALVVFLLLSLIEHADMANFTPTGLFLPYWYGFSAGAITYWTIIGRLKLQFLLGILLLLLGFTPFWHGDALIVTSLTSGLLYLAFRLCKMSIWLADPLTQFLGRISYSLYLFHPLIGWSAQSLVLRFMSEWVALTVGLVASVVSAWATYLLLERPAIRWSHYISVRSTARST